MTKIPFLERLQTGETLISDGATGTNHQHRGLGTGVPPDDLVFDNPEQVLGLHRDFVEAGSDIILTDTFGGTPLRMSDSKYQDRAADLNRRAAELARQAADPHGVYVAGSLGPTGSLFEPMGPLTHAEAVETYAVQAAALTEGGVDFLIIETMFALEEARAVIEGARKASDLPLICSFSFDMGVHTMMGTTPTQMVEELKPLGLDAIGSNCGKSLEFMDQVLEQMVAAQPGVPIWIKPNAGLPIAGEWPPEYDVGPKEMGAQARHYVDRGAQIVGGCCGSTPDHIRAIADAVKSPREEGVIVLRGIQKYPHFLELVYDGVIRMLAPFRRWLVPGGSMERVLVLAEKVTKKPMFDCQMCGQCVLHSTGMTCPMSCPKNIRNGPCGGVRANGNCEIKPEMTCVWVEAWERTQRMPVYGDEMLLVLPPVDRQLEGSSAWVNDFAGLASNQPEGWEL